MKNEDLLKYIEEIFTARYNSLPKEGDITEKFIKEVFSTKPNSLKLENLSDFWLDALYVSCVALMKNIDAGNIAFLAIAKLCGDSVEEKRVHDLAIVLAHELIKCKIARQSALDYQGLTSEEFYNESYAMDKYEHDVMRQFTDINSDVARYYDLVTILSN